jgi:hypothetical protein
MAREMIVLSVAANVPPSLPFYIEVKQRVSPHGFSELRAIRHVYLKCRLARFGFWIERHGNRVDEGFVASREINISPSTGSFEKERLCSFRNR